MSISCYLRTERPKRVAEGDDMGNDVFLGGIKFTPNFENNDPEEWHTLVGGSGKIQVAVAYSPSTVSGYQSFNQSIRVTDFDLTIFFLFSSLRVNH